MSRFSVLASSVWLAMLATLAISISSGAAIAPPTVTSFNPASTYEGEYGQTITITGSNFSGASSVKIGGQAASFRVVNSTTIKAEVPASAYTYWIVVTTAGGTAYSKDNFVIKPIPAPTITSFAPTSAYVGEIGQTITITGTNFKGVTTTKKFSGTTAVTIGGQNAKFTVVNATTIKAIVPASASTYWITVTTSGGTAYSKDNFVINPVAIPSISSFIPVSSYAGESGSKVTITGQNFKGTGTINGLFKVTSVLIGGSSASFNVVNDTTIMAVVPDSVLYPIYPISVTNSGGTGYSKDNYTVMSVPVPTITSFTPTYSHVGETGCKVTLTGTNFKGKGSLNGLITTSSVMIGGTSASFKVVNDTSITAVVPVVVAYAAYPITVTTNGGTAYSNGNFVVKPIPAPTISSFTPSTGGVGDTVTITGTNFNGIGAASDEFTGTSMVKIGGTPTSFTVVSDTSITAKVPANAAYPIYQVSVTTSGGTAYSANNFTINAMVPPVITSFLPTKGKAGDVITITGKNLTDTTSVKFNDLAAVIFTVVSATSITATVPDGATTGKISVTTPGGTAASASNFTVLYTPTITSFTPISGKEADSVTITGTNFTGATGVKFNGLPAVTFSVVSAISMTATVPDGATTGKIAITTLGGTATSASNFTVLYTPTITSFTPVSGKVADSVTITGTNFTGATGVKFNGLLAITFTVVNSTSITATVPDGATTGKIAVTTPGGTATSAEDFTVNQPMTQSGSIVVWGDNTFGQVNTPDPNQDYVEVTGGFPFIAALKKNGSVVCWGNNDQGQCNIPAPNQDFTSVSSSWLHSAGLKVDGSIVCWGENNQGDGDVPAPNENFIAVKAGWLHTVGLKRNGTIIAWGSNTSGQCTVPEPNACYVAVAAGAFHSLALRSDGSVVAWGQNSNGECNVPAPNQDFVSVSAGNSFSVGLKRDGSVVCWGSNGVGECDVPAPNNNFVSIITGASHTAGLKRDGSLVCWGYNYFNQCNVPEPNIGIVAIGAGDQTTMAIRSNTDVASSPTISFTNPTLGKAGDVVTIFGSHFTGSTAVKFNGTDAYYTVESDICISATVPANATTGKVSVTNTFGTGLSRNDFIICVPPTIDSFSPNAGRVGDSVTIYGTGFVEPTIVRFNGIPTVIHSEVSSTSITTTVPVGSSTGNITVTTLGGSAISADVFKVYQPPTIASFSPHNGNVGDRVTIAGTNFTGATAVEFNGTTVATYTVVSADFIHATVPDGATTGKISVTTPDGSATSTGDFTVYQPPTITSFSPAFGKVGDHITITGTNLTGTTNVNFSGPSGAIFTVDSNTSISATVPEGATTGKIYITTPDGMTTSADDFTVFLAPTITSFSPTSGTIGDVVTITGTNFTSATAVKFNGTTAVTYSVVSDTTITSTVPEGATTGKISVTTPGGTATCVEDFIVLHAPAISSFTPTSGNAGDVVTITGANFIGVTDVQFNGITAQPFNVVNNTTITAIVPSGISVGKIAVTTPTGTAMSTEDFIFGYTWHSYGGNEYALTSSRQPWLDNEAEAVSLGGHLVTIETAEEDAWLSETFNNIYCIGYNGSPGGAIAHIGYYLNSGNAAWISGKPMGYTSMKEPGGLYGFMCVNPHPYAPYRWGTGSLHTIGANLAYGIIERYGTVIAAPTISSFSPASGKVGDSITITGTNFTGATAVNFNGTPAATYSVASDTTITATVPVGATTGKISVSTPGGMTTSLDDFTVNTVFVHTWYRYGNSEYALTSSRTFWWNNEAEAVSVGGHLVTIESVEEDCWLSETFTDIYCIDYEGSPGGAIAQIGYHLNEQTGSWEWISGIPVRYTNHYMAFPQGGTLGYKHLPPHPDMTYSWNANAIHTVGSNLAYGIIERPTSSIPSIYSFSPTSGRVADVVTITGARLSSATAVTFDGILAVFTITSEATVSATVPVGATTGKISITTPVGTATSTGVFTIIGDSNTIVNPVDGAEMVWVSPGDFIMGSNEGWGEGPQRSIYIDGYWMYKYEVTVAQYRAFCQDTNRAMPSAPWWGWHDTHPMVNVFWQDAVDYASWAGASLPTEAQWEKAARGTDGISFPWGNTWDESKCANVSNSSSTMPVGSYPSGISPFGCMDMAGNVWEWCSDWYSGTYYLNGPRRNPLGPVMGDGRVVRGASWSDYYEGRFFRCACRGAVAPYANGTKHGFRCAKAP